MKRYILKSSDVNRGSLILVNGEHKYVNSGEELVEMGKGGFMFNRRASILLQRLLREIRADKNIELVSAWRSVEEQEKIWNDSLAENGEAFTKSYVAAPGHSEHHTGLAIDLGLSGEEIDFIRPNFPYDGVAGLFRKLSLSYGFIERYPKEKESITKIAHEPWHFRYVGMPHSRIMKEKGYCLEEYLDFLKNFGIEEPFLYGSEGIQAKIYYVKSEKEKMFIDIEGKRPVSISGDNMEGFVVTEWTV